MGGFFEIIGKLALKATFAVMAVALFLQFHKPSVPSTPHIDALTEHHVRDFITEFSAMTTGNSATAPDLSAFMLRHISDSAHFETAMSLSMPDGGQQENNLSMDKLTYIDNTLKEKGQLKDNSTNIDIEYIDIGADNRHAYVVTTMQKSGTLPTADQDGNIVDIPLTGTTYCEQHMTLGDDGLIRLTDSVCDAQVEVDPR